MLSLTGMLNIATMASFNFFFLNKLVTKRIGKLAHIPNNGGYLLALDVLNFVHGYLSLDVVSTCMFGSYLLKNIYWSL